MKIYGYEPTQEQTEACLSVMRNGIVFTAAYIVNIALAHNVPLETHESDHSWQKRYIAHRFVDRLIQRERKAGRIVRVRKTAMWKAVKSP